MFGLIRSLQVHATQSLQGANGIEKSNKHPVSKDFNDIDLYLLDWR